MATLVDQIEGYLKSLLEQRQDGTVEIQRSEVAERFRCVPSQVSYVLDTRFTPERGYLVESKRGGGGYIRIVRVSLGGQGEELFHHLNRRIGKFIDQGTAEGLIERLVEDGVVTEREGALLRGAIRREAIAVDLPLRDVLRARILRSMLASLLCSARVAK